MQVHPFLPQGFEGRGIPPPRPLAVNDSGYALLVVATVVGIILWLLGEMLNRPKVTAHAEAQRNLDRWEADLLLSVVFAHMAFCSTEDYSGRKVAHDRFRQTVVQLHQFVTTQNPDENAGIEA